MNLGQRTPLISVSSVTHALVSHAQSRLGAPLEILGQPIAHGGLAHNELILRPAILNAKETTSLHHCLLSLDWLLGANEGSELIFPGIQRAYPALAASAAKRANLLRFRAVPRRCDSQPFSCYLDCEQNIDRG